jgi:hypothetical protein
MKKIKLVEDLLKRTEAKSHADYKRDGRVVYSASIEAGELRLYHYNTLILHMDTSGLYPQVHLGSGAYSASDRAAINTTLNRYDLFPGYAVSICDGEMFMHGHDFYVQELSKVSVIAFTSDWVRSYNREVYDKLSDKLSDFRDKKEFALGHRIVMYDFLRDKSVVASPEHEIKLDVPYKDIPTYVLNQAYKCVYED